jgi:ribonuclease BN (tRNA processing enzyme)
MQIRVLGCHGAKFSKLRTCGFLINGSVLLDAGTICSSLTFSEQSRIRYVLLSHIHADHIKDLTFLSENLIAEKKRRPVVIISLAKVLAGLQRNLFNNQIWPDFTKLPNDRNPVFRLKTIREGQTIKIDGLEITAFRVNHIIPCAGFLIRNKHSSFVYSGDTHETDRLWKAAAEEPHLKAALIETSFPNALERLATISKHLTPRLLLKEFLKIKKPALPLYIYHMKPRYMEMIRRELKQLKIENLTVLKDGQILEL